MATSKETIQTLSDAFSPLVELEFRAMFGEYGCYHDGKLIGLVCDDLFHLKVTTGLADFALLERRPPYPGAKPHAVLPREQWGTSTAAELILATSELLPMPKPKRKK
jgi:TfoX/Sxy family transcriptional regulator of competence genes